MEQTVSKVRLIVRIAELALTRPYTQSRTPWATNLRTLLIRQIWWGDRLVAMARDGEDFSKAFANIEANSLAVQAAMRSLGGKHVNKETD